MRQINVSVEVFAKIWSLHKAGDETENDILERVLDIGSVSVSASASVDCKSGLEDRRNGVVFPEGFEIHRKYKGRSYTAVARNGMWCLAGSDVPHRSINSISREIIDGNENAWVNWYFTDNDGSKRLISDLRPKERVSRRFRRGRPGALSARGKEQMTWRGAVVLALRNLGGQAGLEAIYKEVTRIRRESKLSLPRALKAIVRKELEYNSSDSEAFLGKHDLFFSVDGLGSGCWGLRR